MTTPAAHSTTADEQPARDAVPKKAWPAGERREVRTLTPSCPGKTADKTNLATIFDIEEDGGLA